MNHEPRCSFYFLLGENSLLARIDEMTVVLKKCKEWLLSTKYEKMGKKRQKLTVKIHDVLTCSSVIIKRNVENKKFGQNVMVAHI